MSKDPKFKVQQLSAVAAICSAAAALISVFLSAYAVYMAKSSLDHAVRMEQIRIRPHIDIAGGRFYAFDVIKIINTGLGPAIIESIVISNGETKIDLADPKVNRSPNVWSAIEAIFKFQESSFIWNTQDYFSIQNIDKGSGLGQGESFPIFLSHKYESMTSEQKKALEEILMKFQQNGNITIIYCSFDKIECFTTG
ncbi:MAG: hypothetical protein H6877_13315 [Rhodobiaceae bacterium]|nr:hypothetical protein [Rhodobiaceae bacterium]MCC0062027.1 hypothetical protein [Rhodobiaceae bacterium]